PELSAEQLGQLPGDGEAEPGAPVTAAAPALHLLEWGEDALLILGGDPDPRVPDGEGHPGAVPVDVKHHLAAVGELDRVPQEVGEDLVQPLAVGPDLFRNPLAQLDAEEQALLP